MAHSSCDVLIIGSGPGAAAIARQMRSVGAGVTILQGVGCARFKHLDGGILNPEVLRKAIGTSEGAPLHRVGEHTVFRRDLLEEWAVSQLGEGITIREGFEEAMAVPHDTGRVSVIDASGEQQILASSVVLTEGANPKIGIAARLREDFDPEDMIHFGRAVVRGDSVKAPAAGAFRTSWGVPGWYNVIPHPDGALVGASARIENIMRVGRDGREVLKDFLTSQIAGDLGIQGEIDEIGMELVPLRSTTRPTIIGAHNISINFDANGSIDPRSLNRYNIVLASGLEMGSMLAKEWPQLVEWDEAGLHVWDVFADERTPYHDDRGTGFIEDGAAPRRGILQRLLNR